MKISKRVRRLREQSLNAVETLSCERAVLLTEFYRKTDKKSLSVPVRRAMAFEYILRNKKICINEGELIVGERGPEPKATPTYPEICLHSLKDLEILNSRKKVSFSVSDEVKAVYRDKIIPYWQGKSSRDKIMASMSSAWKAAYEAGVFTEFQEQRAPGHTVLGHKIFSKGLLEVKAEITDVIKSIDCSDSCMEELRAMVIACDAIIMFAARHADLLTELSERETSESRKKELLEMAAICRKVPANAPETVHEMLQHYWFIHLGVITELNPWDSFNPGRLDQHLIDVYQKELKEGTITEEKLDDLLGCFWIKFNNHPSPPKIGVTANESNTYTDFCLVNLGGVKPDGSDGVNTITYKILDVIKEMRLLQP